VTGWVSASPDGPWVPVLAYGFDYGSKDETEPVVVDVAEWQFRVKARPIITPEFILRVFGIPPSLYWGSSVIHNGRKPTAKRRKHG
jgi:hypothetical protein